MQDRLIMFLVDFGAILGTIAIIIHTIRENKETDKK